MSLRDEHLQKALKHAPDSDLAPSEIVRKNVLNYANKVNNANKPSQRPHGYWLAGLLSNIKNWPKKWYFAGMGSVVVALLAVIMLREQLPQEPIWRESDVQDIAQNTAPPLEKSLKEEPVGAAEQAATVPTELPAPVARSQQKAKAEESAPVLADKDNVVIAATPTVAAPEEIAAKVESAASAPVEQTLAKQKKNADTESNDRLEASPANDVVASAEVKSDSEKPAASARKSVALADIGAKGAAKAKQDIQAGVLRILVAEWPADKALLDDATGYRVEVLTGLEPEELAAYNQNMRDWHKSQH